METKLTARRKTEIAYEHNIANALAPLNKGVRSAVEMRVLIMKLERAIQAIPNHMTVKDFDTRHHFAKNIYMRELHIPAGCLLTGEIHKTEHLNILSQGELVVWTEDGMKRLTASTVVKSLPGIKRAGYALTDSVWITVHHNPGDGQDLEVIGSRLFAKDFAEIFGPDAMKQIEKEEG